MDIECFQVEGLIDPVPRLYLTLRATVKHSTEKIRQECDLLIIRYALIL